MYFKIIALLFALHAYCEASKHPLDSCKIKVEPLGCYHDKSNDRAMTNEILNARQADRSVYAGYMISWRDWTKYLPKFICQCAEIAYAKGYRTMGIQFYGECWGSMRGHLDYKKHGKAETCVHGEKREAWGRCTKGVDVACTGEALTNFVYRIAPTACDTYYEPGGCFKDNQNKPRPLPDYLMNERDYSTDNWNGHLINWRNWNTYSPQMICRCAQKAKEMGKKTFSIQFYGECWTGDESKLAVARDGVSQKCLAEDYLACPYNSYHCVGQDHANRVYHIKQTPPTARPWKNPKGPAILFGKKK
eukprot:Seg1615.3 transcript_id=Seg1615.3/GoldUCD/mRNA.D3Y31 product="hypothetical protein" protein_id=Seg1615.3/GoldUCD/D3Y31